MDKYLTPDDVAAALQVHMETVLRWARTGKLPGSKIGKLWRFRPSDVDAFVRGRQPAQGDALSVPF